MKVRKTALYLLAAALVLPAAANAASSPVKAGKWQVTMQMDMPGMPFKMPPIKHEQCITPEQAENPEATLPKGSQKKNNDCKVGDYKVDGNTISWTVSCPKEKITGEGSMTYEGDSYTGQMDMKMDDKEMHMKYSGKRLGDC